MDIYQVAYLSPIPGLWPMHIYINDKSFITPLAMDDPHGDGDLISWITHPISLLDVRSPLFLFLFFQKKTE